MSAKSLRPMSAGEILDGAFQIYRRNLVPMFVTCLIVLVPSGVVLATATLGATESDSGIVLLGIAYLIAMVASGVAWVATTWHAHSALTGGEINVSRALTRGIKSSLWILIIFVLLYLLTIVAILPLSIVGVLSFAGATLVSEGVPQILTLIAAALVTLGVGVVVLTWIGSIATLAIPSLVVENVNPIRALTRANRLSKGGRIKVVGVSTIGWALWILPVLGLSVLFGLGSALWDPEAIAALTAGQLYTQQAINFGISAITTPLFATILVLIYYDRRVRREGYDVDLAAAEVEAVAE